ncbi:MAG TPA: serine/threonine-protein kinase [Candidatus Obscuribacterales bacterium]
MGVALKFCPECFHEYQDDVAQCPADGSTLSGIEPDPLVGTRLSDRYEIQSVLGRGGMGVVYKARHEHLDRVVAIKMLHRHLVSDAEALKRFHREAKAVSRVKHPHSVRLYDFGISTSGQPYIVMDYIEGISLKRVLKQEGPLSLERAGHIFGQVVEALSCAHSEGVIHRDLKPENIMLTWRGNDRDWVEVVDFGISKLRSKDNITIDQVTKLGDVCGSPPYMSPEQCLASVPVDARSDIYSLAVVVYESLAGRLPFKAKTAVEMIDCHLYASPTPLKAANPELSSCDALTTLLARALHKEPEKRHQSMSEFGTELKEAIRRDAIKLRSIGSLAEALSVEESGAAAAAAEAGSQDQQVASHRHAPAIAAEPLKAQRASLAGGAGGRLVSRREGGLFGRMFAWLLGKRRGGGDDEPNYILENCPYCNAAVQAKIKFCLECGRILPSPQELSRLRTAQGIFSYPKGRKVGPDVPEFSTKARAVTSRAGIRERGLLIFNLALILALCWFLYAAWSEQRPSPAIKEGGDTTRGDARKSGGKQRPGSQRGRPARAG